jgi:hypothetical protein
LLIRAKQSNLTSTCLPADKLSDDVANESEPELHTLR